MARTAATTKVSMVKFNQMAKKLANASKKAKKVQLVAGEKIEHLVRSTEVVASGVAAGVMRGKWGKKEVGGVPMELVIGGALHLAGLFGVGGEMKSHLHAFGDGMLAVFGADIGETLGKGGFKALKIPGMSGALEGNTEILGGQRLSDDELAELSR